MQLYDGGRAPNPRRVRVFLAEKGIDIPRVSVDLGKLEQMSEAFTAINPMQRVPVLVLDDGTAISESIAICRYLEALHPEPNLFGRDPKEIALIEMWLRRVELNFYSPVSTVFRHLHPAMAEREVPQVPAWGEANKSKALAFLALLDIELGKRAYIACERFSMADIIGFITVDFMKVAKLALPGDMMNVHRWYKECTSRPSAAA